MTKRLLGLILALSATVIATAFILLSPSEQGLGWIDPLDQRLVNKGKPLYAEHCAECHGGDLQGETPEWKIRKEDGTLPAPPHDATGHTWHHPDQVLFDYTRKGGAAIAPAGFESGMPAFEEALSDHEIIAVLAFIKSKWPPEQRRHQKRVDSLRREASR